MAKARRMIDVNFVAAVSFAACVVPQLFRHGNGQIGFVASVAGYRGLPKSLIYGPTKAALINFAESLYLDLQPRNIGVRVINPGFVATPLAWRRSPLPAVGRRWSFPAMPPTKRVCALPGTPCSQNGAVSMSHCTWRATMCRCAPGSSIWPRRGG